MRGLAALAAYVALALLQLALFLPVVSGGRGVDAPPYRVDALSLLLGVSWTLAMALAHREGGLNAKQNRRRGLLLVLTSVAMLNAVYALEAWLLYVGWELATLGLWVALLPASLGSKRVRLALPLHLAGLPLLVGVLLGLMRPFAPPLGGVAEPWPLLVTVALVAVALARSWSWLPYARQAPLRGSLALSGLYAVFAPFLLAKALMAAPWDPVGVWLISLLGSVAFLGGAVMTLASDGTLQSAAVASALAGAAIIGFGLSPGSPLAAAGAIALVLSGMIWVIAIVACANKTERAPLHSGALLAGGLIGVWLISQGALGLHYGIVAAILLPGMGLLALSIASNVQRPTSNAAPEQKEHAQTHHVLRFTFYASHAALGLSLLAAIYPQAVVEFALRPAAQAMAGGVPALVGLRIEWWLGLLVSPPQGDVQAAWPASGMALAALLALLALYWLRRLVALFTRDGAGAPPT